MTTRRAITLFVTFLLIWAGCSPAQAAYTVTTPLGQKISFETVPRRVVSVYPTASEILAALGKAEAVAGITLHDRAQAGLEDKPIVGGFAQPDVERIVALQPDLVIAAPMQKSSLEALAAKGISILYMDTLRLSDAPANIRCLGAVLHSPDIAESIVTREESSQRLITEKLARIGERKPVRVMRIMAVLDDTLIVPGDDSFQNELIALAGGVAPQFGADGQAIRIQPDQLRTFNPDYVYVGDLDPSWVKERLSGPEWGGLSAKVLVFPSDLICRAATNYGFFSLCLSAELYAHPFAQQNLQAYKDVILSKRPVTLPFSYVAETAVLQTRVFDFPAKTLTISFKSPQQVLSSLDGWRSNITTAGNHYSSPPSWPVTHHVGLDASNARILALYGLEAKTATFLYTGADMDKLAYAQTESDGMVVGAFVTAGVSGNAMRAPVDTGRYVEHGTINIILLTNRQLTPEAMTRAMITATEAKTAALEDLDIRSSYSGKAATGTGTDNILVVAGSGPRITMTGGHTKMGELIAKATYKAVSDAIRKQNNIIASRDIFQRLAERKISLQAAKYSAVSSTACSPQEFAAALERTLLEPRYAGFLEAALALADKTEYGLIQDTKSFSAWCLATAGELAGKEIHTVHAVFTDATIPPLVREALNALAAGIYYKK
ncbi:MAG: adenosylcobinamide amidohydrolase [Desulfovibrio sp.]|jgi:adenosylcobinamide amidohydrolase/ABC-type Fe3+-hydroxamate transport system substrate-binding protein|nr:adenosylcobinamide amidohydrolase [Desulfovibrio sp.]